MNERSARKEHWCCFCQTAIKPGTRYIDGFWLFEGEPSPWKAHLDCQAFANRSPYAGEGIPPFSDWDEDDLAEMTPDDQAEFQRLVSRTAPQGREGEQ